MLENEVHNGILKKFKTVEIIYFSFLSNP